MTTTTDAATFTPTFAVNDQEIIDGQAVHLPGHQLMPSLAFAGGKLMLVYFDLRETRSQVHAKWIDDRTAIDFGHDPVTGLPSRHTVDLRAVMGTPGPSPVFDRSVKVSDYIQGIHPTRGLEDLQANPPNLPMFRIGTVPFIGDYIDIQPAPSIVPLSNGSWGFNTAATPTLPVFHAVWTDNRDVRPPQDFNWKNYAPPTFAGPSPLDPTRNVPQCFPGTNPGSRNQNIYTARITGGLLVGSPGNSKQLSPTLQRSFVVFVQNNTQQTRAFRLTIQNQPAGGRASFSQFPQPPYNAQSPPPLIVIDATVPPRSMASRTVYATSTNPRAPINVSVVEIGVVGQPPPPVPLGGTIVLNPDLANPDLANPDYANPDLANPDLANAEVGTPDLANPDLANPDLANFLVMTPDLANPRPLQRRGGESRSGQPGSRESRSRQPRPGEPGPCQSRSGQPRSRQFGRHGHHVADPEQGQHHRGVQREPVSRADDASGRLQGATNLAQGLPDAGGGGLQSEIRGAQHPRRQHPEPRVPAPLGPRRCPT